MKRIALTSVRCVVLAAVMVITLWLSPVVLAAPSCSATVDPHIITGSGTTNIPLSFTVINTGASMVNWVRIARPSDNYTFKGASASGWNAAYNSREMNLENGTLPTGDSVTIALWVTTVTTATSSENFIVQVSDAAGGSSIVNCTGSVGVSIVAPNTGPTISNITVSDVTSSSVKVNWTTDIAATGQVDFGTSALYGDLVSDATLTTYHSLTLSGLSANTTYHFDVISAAGGVTRDSGDRTFATAVAVTGAPTSIPLPTATAVPQATGVPTAAPTATPVPTPLPTPIPDKTPPTVVIVSPTAIRDLQRTAPEFRAKAFDAIGVTKTEYSLDAGKTWTTLPNAKGLGSSVADMTLTPLVVDGAYAIRFRAFDKAGNKGQSESLPFVIDRTPPVVTISTDLTKPYLAAPAIAGTTTEAHGLTTLAYSVDNGVNWIPVTNVGSSGVQHAFSFTPQVFDDGNYPIVIRAADSVGNEVTLSARTLVIDRLPPRIGLGLYSIGSTILDPVSPDTIEVLPGMDVTATMSVVGGPLSVELTARDAGTGQTVRTVSLAKDANTGLWRGKFTLDSAGSYTLTGLATDGAGNRTTRLLAQISVPKPGFVSADSRAAGGSIMTVYAYDGALHSFRKWHAEAYGVLNPQKVSSDGSFLLFLPAGRYYVEITGGDINRARTGIFEITSPTFLTETFSVSSRRKVSIGPWTFFFPELPWQYESLQTPSVAADTGKQDAIDSRTGKRFPAVAEALRDVKSVRLGSVYLVTFLATWHPGAPKMLRDIEEAVKQGAFIPVGVLGEESTSQGLLFGSRGGYDMPFVSDPDGELVEQLNVHLMPLTLVMDAQGKVLTVSRDILPRKQNDDMLDK